MKKRMLWALMWCLLLSALTAARASGTGGLSSVSEEDEFAVSASALSAEQALFDEGVRTFVPRTFGNVAHYMNIDGWIIQNNFVEPTGSYALIGSPPSGGEPVTLCEFSRAEMVPAGDAIVYISPEGWVLHEPGKEPEKLPLSVMDSVFYADEDYIWYSTIGTGNGSQMSIRTLNRKNNQREGLARFDSIQIFDETMLDDGGVLLYNRDENRVLRWRDGATETLLETDEPIRGVFSTGQEIWVELEEEIGLLEDGGLSFRIPGNRACGVFATGQTALLLWIPGSDAFDVLVLNDAYRAYARLGCAPIVDGLAVVVAEDGGLIVRTADRSVDLSFGMPPAGEWIPYGFYDIESAKETVSLDGLEKTVTVTVEAALAAGVNQGEAQAEAEALGIYFAGNRDGSFTYAMTLDQQRALLDRRMADLRAAMEGAPQAFAGLQRCEVGDDWGEITLYVTAEMSSNMRAMVSKSFGLGMAMCRALAGEESPRTLVHIVDGDTGSAAGRFWVPSE